MIVTARRVVRIASIAYRDEQWAIRRADHGQSVEVHADDVARFDSLNGEPPPVSLDAVRPKRRGRPPKNRNLIEDSNGGVRDLG